MNRSLRYLVVSVACLLTILFARPTQSQVGNERPDYIKIIESHFSEGVTPENNLFAHLAKVVPVEVDDAELKKQLYDKLGIAIPDKSNLLLPFVGWIAVRHADIPRSRWEASMKATGSGMWKPADHPLVDEWLNEQEAHLDAIVEASKQRHAFEPLVFPKGERYVATNRHLLVNMARRLANPALMIRANRSCGQKDFDRWSTDIDAAKRIALAVSSGHSWIHKTSGLATFRQVNTMVAAAIRSGNFSDDELAKLRQSLTSDKLVGGYREQMLYGERYFVLDCVRYLQDTKQMSNLLKDDEVKELVGEITVDWAAADKAAAEVFEMVESVLVHETTRARVQAAVELEDDIRKLEAVLQHEAFESLTSNPQSAGKWFGKHVACTSMPSLFMILSSQASHETERTLQITAIDLERFRFKNRKYPTSLKQLVPSFQEAIPTDAHTDQPLIYKLEKDSWSLYSLGRNGVDNDGAPFGDCCLQPLLAKDTDRN